MQMRIYNMTDGSIKAVEEETLQENSSGGVLSIDNDGIE